ncbi:restriction endonuclease subunit S [Salinicoccus albus]|uniref:restriction endonuclease subunit S n=1 Tax=Salinicoccus albus TaxID=418756 RepID=UPI00036C54F8|nr:restriction endonuclease subunit S [Salinicoccus albus]
MNEWISLKLEDVAEISGGGTPSRQKVEYWNGEVKWATPTDITKNNNKYLYNTEDTITEEGLNRSSAKLIPENNVLMTSRASIGKCVINKIPTATNQGFTNFISKKYKIDSEFLYYQLLFHAKHFEQLGAGSTFKEISKSELRSYNINIPKQIQEQQKIANILSTVDEMIDKTEVILTQTEKVKKGLIQKLLTKGIDHTKFKQTEIGYIPEEWEVKQFSECINVNPTYRLKKGENVPFVEMAAVQENRKEISYFSERVVGISGGSRFSIGDTLFARITPCTENGKIAFVEEMTSQFGMGSTEFIVFSPKKDQIIPQYVYYLVRSHRIRDYAIKRMIGTTGRQRVPKIVFIEELFIGLPTKKEQQKIVDILTSVDNKIIAEEQKLSQLRSLKNGLMQQLLTGKQRVQVDNNEEVPL